MPRYLSSFAAALRLAQVCIAQSPAGSTVPAADWPASFAKCHPVPLRKVETRGFLGDRVARNAASLLKGMATPFPKGFEERAAGTEPGPETRRLAAAPDLYKWLEGAANMVVVNGDKEVERQLERIVAISTMLRRIALAQLH